MLKKVVVLLLAVLVAAVVVPGVVEAQVCKPALAIRSGDGLAVTRFQRAMTQALLAAGIQPILLADSEAAELMSVTSFDAERVNALRRLGACRVISVELDPLQEQQISAAASGTSPIIALIIGLASRDGNIPRELEIGLGLLQTFTAKHRSVTVVGFEATAMLLELPRSPLFSQTITGKALVADDGSAMIQSGFTTREIRWSQRSEVDTATLRLLADELVRAMRSKL